MCLTGKEKLRHVKGVPTLGRHEPPKDVIRAWRAWKLDPYATDTLKSTYAKKTWDPLKPMKAHQALKTGQGAVGVHAVKNPHETGKLTNIVLGEKNIVLGEILLWGDVVEVDNGYRAEYGYPYRLWTNNFLATSELRDRYGVAVEIKSVQDFLADYPIF